MYQWLVKQGRVGIYIEDQYLVLDIDPEGQESCLLTYQDTLDISKIMTELARELWNRSDKGNEYHQSLNIDGDDRFTWDIDGCNLVLSTSQHEHAIEIKYDNDNRLCRLSVEEAVEVIQILQLFIGRHHSQSNERR